MRNKRVLLISILLWSLLAIIPTGCEQLQPYVDGFFLGVKVRPAASAADASRKVASPDTETNVVQVPGP